MRVKKKNINNNDSLTFLKGLYVSDTLLSTWHALTHEIRLVGGGPIIQKKKWRESPTNS